MFACLYACVRLCACACACACMCACYRVCINYRQGPAVVQRQCLFGSCHTSILYNVVQLSIQMIGSRWHALNSRFVNNFKHFHVSKECGEYFYIIDDIFAYSTCLPCSRTLRYILFNSIQFNSIQFNCFIPDSTV